MNCHEALNLLYDILDKEAEDVDAEQVQQHLKQCSHCSEIYRLEGAVNQFLRKKIEAQRGESGGDLESLKSRILKEIEDQDCASGGKGGLRPPFEMAAKTLVAAAALVILLGAAFLLSGYYEHYKNYQHLESAHEQALSQLSGFDNPNHTSEALALVNDELGFTPRSRIAGFSLTGGTITELKGVPAGHFVYRQDTSVISVFVCNCELYSVPEDVTESSTEKAGHIFYDHDCPGCRLCYHENGGTLLIAATSDPAVDLHDFFVNHYRAYSVIF
jgi:anti-sigma factor (TIGR02949 family)